MKHQIDLLEAGIKHEPAALSAAARKSTDKTVKDIQDKIDKWIQKLEHLESDYSIRQVQLAQESKAKDKMEDSRFWETRPHTSLTSEPKPQKMKPIRP